ncbi:MAG TPA: hypothetical protein VMB21_18975 [Candidatus Limnocylindria bacterium]|nr:hypothetical protein [Candidatus Limnocylindria bacterium]
MPRLAIALFLVLAAFTGRAEVATGKPTNAVPADAFVVRRFELLRPFPAPRLIGAQFPPGISMAAVESMAFSEGRLWLAARPRGATEIPPGTGHLWVFTLDSNVLEPVGGVLQPRLVNALHASGSRLWLALDGGAARFAPDTRMVDTFGTARGLNSTNVVGFTDTEAGLVALGETGGLYSLPPGGSSFTRLTVPAPTAAQRESEPWRFFAGSRDWLLAASDHVVLNRNIRATQWLPLKDELGRHSSRLASPRLTCVTGDGEGGFWLGSDAGLHWLNPDDGAVENRFAPVGVIVPGGLGITIAPGYQASAAGYAQARTRVMAGVRDRMRQRARLTRAAADAGMNLSPVVPTSRLPGGVTALLQDHSFLWVATTDGANTNRGRVLLLHAPSRRWIGWFLVGAPVRSLAVNDRFLWVGLDVTRTPAAAPLLALEKLPLTGVLPVRWTPDALNPEELGNKLASLPVKERAVYAFFGGEPAKVVELLAPDGRAREGIDAESLFLLAFAHDATGLDRPDRLDAFLTQLRAQFPDSLFTEIADSVRPAAHLVTAAPAEAGPETVADVLQRRDLNGDGKLNPIEFKLWRGPNADFKAADKNGDGELEAAELEAVLKAAGR